MINVPCYKCKDRQLNCHSKCIKYKEYKEKTELTRKNRRDHQLIRSDIIDARYRITGKGWQV